MFHVEQLQNYKPVSPVPRGTLNNDIKATNAQMLSNITKGQKLIKYEEYPHSPAPTKFIKAYALLSGEIFLNRFNIKPINKIITPTDAMISDTFILAFF